MAVHYPGDYGGDAAAGAKVSADANGIDFVNVETTAGPDNQARRSPRSSSSSPDLVLLAAGPTDVATIVGQAAAAGLPGPVHGLLAELEPGDPGLAGRAGVPGGCSAPGPVGSVGRRDRRRTRLAKEALGDVEPNEFYTAGWFWSYPLKAALEAAAENGDLTRAGLREAADEPRVDRLRGPAARGLRQLRRRPERGGVAGDVHQQHRPGRPAPGCRCRRRPSPARPPRSYDFAGPCYEEVDLG